MVDNTTLEDSSSRMIQLSCPECENLVITEFVLGDNDAELHQDIANILEIVIGDTKHYSFKGSTKCECGNIVVSSLTVSAYLFC